MKRILAKILCGVFFFACMLGLVACGKGNGEKKAKPSSRRMSFTIKQL